MKKKLLALLLCVGLLASCVPAVSAYGSVSHWAVESVDAMYDLGFLPQEMDNADMTATITRGEMCKMAVLVFEHLMGGYAYPDSTGHFSDTTDASINYAYEQGIVGGYPDGTFRPNDPLSRQDFFKITYNLMGSAYCDTSDVARVPLSDFPDASSVSNYAKDATQTMVSIGIVQGSDGCLKPLSETSRQEAVIMFLRAYQYMCNWFKAQTEETKSIQIRNEGYTGISNWAVREVEEMQRNGMIPSCLDRCNMSLSITRAQMCSVAVLAYEKSTGEKYTAKATDHFTDTDNADVCAAYELGIVNGHGDGTFGPNDVLTREQFFRIMSNFMSALGYPRTDSRSVSLSKYGDGSRVSGWAQPATRLLIYAGCVSGDGKNLYPQNSTTIEEAIAVFLRCYKYTAAWKEAYPNGEEYREPSVIEDLIVFAKSHVGCPYVYGGNGPNSFDCSGFVLYVYRHFGYGFSRGAQEQYNDGVHVGMDDLRPGDLVFFSGNGYSITHVGLYLGEGKFIHAANPSQGVLIESLWSGYYRNCFYGGCRIITD